jgi:hypothetical protein
VEWDTLYWPVPSHWRPCCDDPEDAIRCVPWFRYRVPESGSQGPASPSLPCVPDSTIPRRNDEMCSMVPLERSPGNERRRHLHWGSAPDVRTGGTEAGRSGHRDWNRYGYGRREAVGRLTVGSPRSSSFIVGGRLAHPNLRAYGPWGDRAQPVGGGVGHPTRARCPSRCSTCKWPPDEQSRGCSRSGGAENLVIQILRRLHGDLSAVRRDPRP